MPSNDRDRRDDDVRDAGAPDREHPADEVRDPHHLVLGDVGHPAGGEQRAEVDRGAEHEDAAHDRDDVAELVRLLPRFAPARHGLRDEVRHGAHPGPGCPPSTGRIIPLM